MPLCTTAVVRQPITGCGEAVATGNPPPAISEKGLPPGVDLHDNANGTASISGAPTKPGTYRVTLRAKNAGSSVSKSFVIKVSK
jgi:Putative Ig domain